MCEKTYSFKTFHCNNLLIYIIFICNNTKNYFIYLRSYSETKKLSPPKSYINTAVSFSKARDLCDDIFTMPGIQHYFPSDAQTGNLKEGKPQTDEGIFSNLEENMVHGLSSCYQKETENLPKITLYTICSLWAAHSYNTTQ